MKRFTTHCTHMPRGELRRELIACLRWSRDKRRSKTRAPSGCGHIMEMQSIHLRPPEVADRVAVYFCDPHSPVAAGIE